VATQYTVPTGTVALVAATAKVVLELPSSATIGLSLIGLDITLSATALGSCVAEWMTYATTGTATTVTPSKLGTDQGPAAITGTVKVNHTAAPGTLASGGLPSWILPLPGMYSMAFPLAREMYWPVSTLRCLRLTSTLACNAQVDVFFEH
jgi:hypothetical protein